jgi:hypothetical protein
MRRDCPGDYGIPMAMAANLRVFEDKTLHESASCISPGDILIASHESSFRRRLIATPAHWEKHNRRKKVV